uniref:ABC-type amino acid transport substrate-binding protein n=1 Tax=Candidatus Kentrum sp. DK TaxID=2126562 RepID=A0A450TGD5_9GAMM|nr:MAG: ABC-type amino acid transport substrate-binding protein [Candidatus Kentron sp. DK]
MRDILAGATLALLCLGGLPAAAEPISPAVAADSCAQYRSGLVELILIVAGVPGNRLADITNGKPRGVVAEATIKILEELGYKPHLVLGSANNLEEEFRGGDFDVAVGVSVSANHRAGTGIIYSDPIIREYSVLLVRAGEHRVIDSFDDLRGVRLGVLAGHQYPGLENHTHSGIILVRQRKDSENVRNLLLKDLDIVVVSSVSDIAEFRGEGIMRALELLDKAVGFTDIGSAFAADRFPPGFIRCFNSRLQQFMGTPQWGELLSRNGIGSLVKTWTLLEH